MTGMASASASSNVMSIIHEMYTWRLRRLHEGGKYKHPTQRYNMTVNHCQRILGTTKGHPGSWHDKTVLLFDTLVKAIKHDDILQDNEFRLLEVRDDVVLKVKYRRMWVVADSGYHYWSVTALPFKSPS